MFAQVKAKHMGTHKHKPNCSQNKLHQQNFLAFLFKKKSVLHKYIHCKYINFTSASLETLVGLSQ